MQTTRVRTLEKIQRIVRAHKEELRTQFGVKRIGIFGSYSRNEQRDKGDVLEGLPGVNVDPVSSLEGQK